MDERFFIHRLKSTSLAGVVCAMSMGGYFLYDQIFNGVLHWDIFYFLNVMAFTKIGAMIYYRKFN